MVQHNIVYATTKWLNFSDQREKEKEKDSGTWEGNTPQRCKANLQNHLAGIRQLSLSVS